MSKIHIGFVAAALILSGPSTLAQSRNLTDQEKLQMQKELAWEKQQKLKADSTAPTSYTQRCYMVDGRLGNCQGSPNAVKPVAIPQTRTSGPVLDSKVGTAYGNPSVAGQSGYQTIQTYKPNNVPKPSQPGVFYNGQKYVQ